MVTRRLMPGGRPPPPVHIPLLPFQVLHAPSSASTPTTSRLTTTTTTTSERLHQARKRRRATSRQETLHAGRTEPPLLRARGQQTLLQKRAVGSTTLRDYKKKYGELLEFACRQGLKLDSLDDETTDSVIADFCDELYLNGCQNDAGYKLISAWKYFHPEYNRGGGMRLPLTTQCMKGWKKAAPSRSRVPLPLEWCFGLLACLLTTEAEQAAILLMLIFDTYARPGELSELQWEDVVPPVASRESSFLRHVTLVIKPQERGCLTKGGEMDDSLGLAEHDFPGLGTKLLLLRALRRRGQKIFTLKPGEFRKQFVKATVQLNLQGHALTSYQARHGGASRDALLRRREWSAIKKRGRWKTDTAMKRYEKHGRLQQLLAHTPAATLSWCQEAADSVKAWLLGEPFRVAPPPTASSQSRCSAAARASPVRSRVPVSRAKLGTI